MINVFVGYDSNEKVGYHVLTESILRNSSQPVSITPLYLPNLRDVFSRKPSEQCSTEFSFSRFIIPHLMNYQGWALFMDCDMLMQADIVDLWKLRDEQFAVQVCKHDYQPRAETKFLGHVQMRYVKKNWSSLMLMNCEKCTQLTPDYVNQASGLELHQFKWLEDETLVGSLPLEWNWLVGEYPYKEDVKNIHYTEGGPYFNDFATCDFSKEWFSVYENMAKIEL